MDDIYTIIPVTKFKNAKTRLSPFLSENEREKLLKVMLQDVSETLKKYVDKIFIISNDKEVLKYAIIKFSIFFTLNLILLILFWYYLTCFNAVYENTQIDLIINAIISFGISCVYPFVINIIPSIFRMDSLDNKNNKKRK